MIVKSIKTRPVQPAQPDPNQQSAAVSGDCLFQSLACTQPNLTHKQVRSDIAKFYMTATQQQLYAITCIHEYKKDLRHRQHVIAPQGVWDEGVDVSAFASIYKIAIKVVVLIFYRQETETITFFPVNIAGNEVKDAKVASTTLHHNGRDHWSVL